jgi:hypothetical protein
MLASTGFHTAKADDSRRSGAHAATLTAPGSPQALTEWTVMVFMDGDNNLEPFALDDFQEMAKVADSSQVNIVVQLDRIPGFSTKFGDWTNTLRFKVRHGMTPTPQNALSPAEAQLPAGAETNMGHPDTLASFVTWARNKYPAKHYMLVIWDHGDGWRLLHTVSLQKGSDAARSVRMANATSVTAMRAARSSRARSLPRTVPFDRSLDAPHRSISLDETDRDRLYMREVQSSLEGAIGASRLDLIGFDACLMEMVENGFAMRRVADVMVGSEELEPGAGWQYDDWLQQLVSNPTMDSPSLGRVLVDSYKRTYTVGAPGVLPDPETTLAAVDLSQGKMAALAQVISDLGDELTASLDTELSNIKAARADCLPYAPGEGFYGIDLHRFCEQLAARTGKQSLRDRAQAVVRMLDTTPIILNAYAGSERQGSFGSRGIAIYFPETKSVYDSDPYGTAYQDATPVDYPVEFVEQHRWDNFLHAYFERVP